MLHCKTHPVFNRECSDCRDAALDHQVEEMLLDREADHDREEMQGADRFASVFDDDPMDQEVLTSRGYIEASQVPSIVALDLD
jgi:hypothetical protein